MRHGQQQQHAQRWQFGWHGRSRLHQLRHRHAERAGLDGAGQCDLQWIKDYNAKCSGATINYQGTGSGAGQTAFIAGQADFAGSDSALKPADQPKADAHCASGAAGGVAIHLPMVVGPIAVVYNVSGVTNLQLKPATLAGIFSGKIKTWNDPAIAADNPGASLPSTKITPVHRADSSGTSDNFTKYLSQTAASDWTFGHDKVWHAPGGDAETGFGRCLEVHREHGRLDRLRRVVIRHAEQPEHGEDLQRRR